MGNYIVMEFFIVTGIKSLNNLHSQPFGKSKIKANLAERLIAENSTGKSIRITQMWCTRHEIEVDGNLYVIDKKDRGTFDITEGSDLN